MGTWTLRGLCFSRPEAAALKLNSIGEMELEQALGYLYYNYNQGLGYIYDNYKKALGYMYYNYNKELPRIVHY